MMEDFLSRLEDKFGIPSHRCQLMIKSALVTAYNVSLLNTAKNEGKPCKQARITSGSIVYLEDNEKPSDLDSSKWYTFF